MNTAAVIDQATDRDWALYLADCCQGIQGLPDASIGFSIYSPPFSNLYIYSDSEADMGNAASDAEFLEHYRFLIREKLRVTKPGRLSAVHCKDLPSYAGRDGAAGLKDFPGQIIRLHEEEGWTYHSRQTIWKCPVIEMTRTKNHGLLYKNLRANSNISRQGMADYVIVFRKWGEGMENDPVPHTMDEFPLERWQKWASPVWDEAEHIPDDPAVLKALLKQASDLLRGARNSNGPVEMHIQQTNVLNVQQARESQDEKHICPLQLDLIENWITHGSNPGDTVLSPFAGIGSEGYVAVKMRRKFIGFELKESYWRIACRNLGMAECESSQLTLSDLLAEVA